jgi:hypothetical protein
MEKAVEILTYLVQEIANSWKAINGFFYFFNI